MENYVCGSGTFRMNLALSELPRFRGVAEDGDHLGSGIIMAPSLDYMDRAYEDALQTGMSKKPIVELLIPSVLDDTLASKGKHVATLFCQQFSPVLPDGRSWDEAKNEAVNLIFDTVNEYAPNFRDSILGYQALSPLDLERTFALVGGDIMHGRMSLDQLWSARPVLGAGAYRTPISGLYMCGAGTHPGGGVTGAPGHNAAQEILYDRSFIGPSGRIINGHSRSRWDAPLSPCAHVRPRPRIAARRIPRDARVSECLLRCAAIRERYGRRRHDCPHRSPRRA